MDCTALHPARQPTTETADDPSLISTLSILRAQYCLYDIRIQDLGILQEWRPGQPCTCGRMLQSCTRNPYAYNLCEAWCFHLFTAMTHADLDKGR